MDWKRFDYIITPILKLIIALFLVLWIVDKYLVDIDYQKPKKKNKSRKARVSRRLLNR